MNENNNLNTGFEVNPSQPVQPNMDAGMNPSQPVQQNMGVGMNTNQPVQPNMGVGMNPSQPVQQNMGVGMNTNQPVQQNMDAGMNPGQPVQSKKGNNKKIIIIVSIAVAVVALVVIAILLLTGKTKTLTCTQEKDMSGMIMTGVVKVDFDGDTVEKMNMKITVDLGSYADYKDTFISSFETQYQSMESRGIPVEITSDDTKVYVELNADKETFKEAGLSTSNSYAEVKSDLESQEFVCE